MHLKDQVLYDLSRHHNVAQFVSFSPGAATLRFNALRPPVAVASGASVDEAIERLHSVTTAGFVNVRSFKQGQLSGNPFHYGISSVSEAIGIVRQLAHDGFYTIVNETIDVNDGGVSGVSE